jgi:hypothetical protein
LESAVALPEVTIEPLSDLAGGGWSLDFVQRSQNVLTETTIRVRNPLHLERRFFKAAAVTGLRRGHTRKSKGRYIGEAPACEGANSMEAWAITALDAITFRGSKLQLLLAEPLVFSGLAAFRVAPPSQSLSLFRTGKNSRRFVVATNEHS